ncbi:MAG: ATP-dependent DNA helicase RecG [Planctomycetota bacterium]|jgi:ATP-dependent DNA helicase RecG
MVSNLGSSVQYLKGVGPARAKLLGRLGIETVRDLLLHFPFRYEDRRILTAVKDLREGESASVRGTVVRVVDKRIRKGKIFQAIVSDGSGEFAATWFKGYGISDKIKAGSEIVLHGRPSLYRKELQVTHPDFEVLEEGQEVSSTALGRIVPIYTLTEGLTLNTLRPLIREALEKHGREFREWLPSRLLERRALPEIGSSLRKAHFPEDLDEVPEARRRFAYEELFLMQIVLALRRRAVRREAKGIRFSLWPDLHRRIRARIPFTLTGAQERACAEILADMEGERPMNRLLQGDVGSGKTVVALYAMLTAVANKAQVAFLAPTEILAEQHFRTLERFLRGGRVGLTQLGGGMRDKARDETLETIALGEADIVVGTHALLQPDVEFGRLGLVVVDEQHKFGVAQRAALRAKGDNPDVLVMTATPIPRTLTLTLFGDLDVSVLDEMPPGRTPPRTRWVKTAPRWNAALKLLRSEIRRGRQAFFVYPLIEESESLQLKSLEAFVEPLRREVFPDFRVGLLHGRMKSEEKDEVMKKFREKEFEILASTTVVEVGIDVPNATLMVVEDAERFGLAQLHQLRGRIGRGGGLSHCFLHSHSSSLEARHRLATMESTSDGFVIAEEDLALRGPGEFFGTRQHGLPELRAADLIRDRELLDEARADAMALVAEDPSLALEESIPVKRTLQERLRERIDYIHVG